MLGNNRKTEISVERGGIPGTVVAGDFGRFEVRAKWASHTGYRSISAAEIPEDFRNGKEPLEVALDWLYEGSKALPWLVGEEHRDNGWKSLEWDDIYHGWRVRVPDWADARVLDVLRQAGFLERCPINRFWVLSGDRLEMSLLKKALAPVLTPGSRLEDGGVLADRLRQSIQPLLARQAQMELF